MASMEVNREITNWRKGRKHTRVSRIKTYTGHKRTELTL